MRDLVEKLKAQGALRTFEREVSGRFELAAVTAASQKPAADATQNG